MKRPKDRQPQLAPQHPRVAEVFAKHATTPPPAAATPSPIPTATVPAIAAPPVNVPTPDVIFEPAPPVITPVVKESVVAVPVVPSVNEPALAAEPEPDPITDEPEAPVPQAVAASAPQVAEVPAPQVTLAATTSATEVHPPVQVSQTTHVRVWLKPIPLAMKDQLTERTYRIGEFAFWQKNCGANRDLTKGNTYVVDEATARSLIETGEIETIVDLNATIREMGVKK